MASGGSRRNIGRPVYLTNLVRDERAAKHEKKETDTRWYRSGPGSWGVRNAHRNYERLTELSRDREMIVHGVYFNPETNEWRTSRGVAFYKGRVQEGAFVAWRANYEDDGYDLVEMLYTYI